jgi:CRISPR system Cascade subunit CasB
MIESRDRIREQKVARDIQSFIVELSGLETGSLALFKRNAGENLSGSRGVLPTFYRLLPRSVGRERDIETYFLVATLYARHDRPGGTGNFAQCMREIVNRGANDESVSRRLAIILDSHREELPFRLRQAVCLVRSYELPIDWALLLEDLLRWNEPHRRVQKGWARTFFGSPA